MIQGVYNLTHWMRPGLANVGKGNTLYFCSSLSYWQWLTVDFMLHTVFYRKNSSPHDTTIIWMWLSREIQGLCCLSGKLLILRSALLRFWIWCKIHVQYILSYVNTFVLKVIQISEFVRIMKLIDLYNYRTLSKYSNRTIIYSYRAHTNAKVL